MKPRAEGRPVGLVLEESDVERQVGGKGNCKAPSQGQLGYDLRLGNQIWPITRGGSKVILTENCPSYQVLPGETIVVATKEVLQLDENVFLTGSPKMRLLIQGLWAHGGKTDFGFRGDLRLAFTNHGASPIRLQRDQEIFHVTFWSVQLKDGENFAYSGSAPDVEPSQPSPLQTSRLLSLPSLKEVYERDGLIAYRAVRIQHMRRCVFRRIVAFGISVALVIGPVGYLIAKPPPWLETGDGVTLAVTLGVAMGGGILTLWIALFKRILVAMDHSLPSPLEDRDQSC